MCGEQPPPIKLLKVDFPNGASPAMSLGAGSENRRGDTTDLWCCRCCSLRDAISSDVSSGMGVKLLSENVDDGWMR